MMVPYIRSPRCKETECTSATQQLGTEILRPDAGSITSNCWSEFSNGCLPSMLAS